MQYDHLRDNRGAAVIGLCLALAMVLTAVAFFVFDMNRMQMAQRQLTAICDSSALAGSAMLTSKDVSYETQDLSLLNTTQLAAEQYAKNMFAMGNILGNHLYDPAFSSAPSANSIAINWVANTAGLANPGGNTVNVLIQLCSPIDNYAVVAHGLSTARAIYVQATFGYVPYVNILGIGNVSLPAQSTSGLQKLLVIMVFDCSGSMDDDTTVTAVERRWSYAGDGVIDSANGGRGQYVYQVVSTPGGGSGAGQLWQVLGHNDTNQPNGTAVNVLPPQNLDFVGYLYGTIYYPYASSSSTFDQLNPPLAFDMAIRSYVPWPAGPAGSKLGLPSTVYNNSYTTAAYNPPGGGFQGPYFDNDFGTPPGNCRVKYGAAPDSAANNTAGFKSGATYGYTSGNVNQSMNIWDGVSGHEPGPYGGNASPGYYYATSGTASSGNNDTLKYYYDPYSMPSVNTNANYTAFTDLVANITSLNYPVTQPLYGPSTFSAANISFLYAPYYVPIAETRSNTASESITCFYEYDGNTSDPDYLSNGSKVFKFSNIAYLVEASRGNLDRDPLDGVARNFNWALLSFGNSQSGSGMTQPVIGDCQYGYQKAYQRAAMYCMQPYATAIDGAYRFFQNLAGTSACAFGFVGFSVAPAVTSNYSCSYVSISGQNNYFSLLLNAPANTTKPTPVYSAYVYEPLSGTNPNFWLTNPMCGAVNHLQSGPAGSPTGRPYDSALNASGPNGENSWITIYNNGISNPSNPGTCWAFNNGGFQIPRFGLYANGDSFSEGVPQSISFSGVAGQNWYGWNSSDPGISVWGNNQGFNGLFRCRPLYETDGLEALEVAYYNLTNIPALNALTGLSTGPPPPNMGPGTRKAIIFFTDGVPTDDSPPFSNYINNVVSPAQGSGVAIYSIGLALNPDVKVAQSKFLSALANKGANGSQYFQVTSNAALESTFGGIARQLASGLK